MRACKYSRATFRPRRGSPDQRLKMLLHSVSYSGRRSARSRTWRAARASFGVAHLYGLFVENVLAAPLLEEPDKLRGRKIAFGGSDM